jgi:hypothetical protein
VAGLSVTISGDSQHRRLELCGRLDESTELLNQVPAWFARRMTLDTGGLVAINSIGIREWMHFLAELSRRGAEIVHERCSEPLIEQMSFIPAARGGGDVRSFHATYLCPACNQDSSMLLSVDEHRATLIRGEAPTLPCPNCPGTMVIADLPDRVFAFLRQ